MLWSGHLSKVDKKFCPKISVYWSKSHKTNLSKADTCLKWTKIFAQNVSALHRFYCIFIFNKLDNTVSYLLIIIWQNKPINSKRVLVTLKTSSNAASWVQPSKSEIHCYNLAIKKLTRVLNVWLVNVHIEVFY